MLHTAEQIAKGYRRIENLKSILHNEKLARESIFYTAKYEMDIQATERAITRVKAITNHHINELKQIA